jgi:hypothetical protein
MQEISLFRLDIPVVYLEYNGGIKCLEYTQELVRSKRRWKIFDVIVTVWYKNISFHFLFLYLVFCVVRFSMRGRCLTLLSWHSLELIVFFKDIVG